MIAAGSGEGFKVFHLARIHAKQSREKANPDRDRLAGCRKGGIVNRRWPQAAFDVPCTIFIAEPINADTSVMLLGTMSVVVASDATWL